MNKILEVLPFILGAYDIIALAYPTKKNYSLIGKIGTALKFLSNVLNVRKGKLNDKLPLVFIICLFFVSCKTLQNTKCISVKYVDVTYITKDSAFITISVPYCDTIQTNLTGSKIKGGN